MSAPLPEPVAALVGARVTSSSQPLSLTLHPGERVVLAGPNGVGKTSLLRVLAGLRAPAAGTVRRATSVGYCAQDYRASLFPWLSAGDNIALSTRVSREAAARAAALVGLSTELLARRPAHLSGGEQQRVALARALCSDARLVLLDEPFSALDLVARAALRVNLRGELSRRGCACVVVTHDLADVAALATRWVVLTGPAGTVQYDGPPADDVTVLDRMLAREVA